MLSRGVEPKMIAAGPNALYPFENTADFLKQFDFTVGNLECVVTAVPGVKIDKGINFKADPIGFKRLQAAGFDLVSVANNHSGDYGPDAFADMLRHLPDYNIKYVGGGFNLDEAYAPAILQKPGTRIGFVAACDIEPHTFQAGVNLAGDLWLDANALQKLVPQARPTCDFLIVFTHWGTEYVTTVNDNQTQLARLAIDLGADLVVGCHPHIIQPYELYKGKLIVYSLGNFVFDRMPGQLAFGNVLTLTLQGSKLLTWKLVETQINFDTSSPHLVNT
jgi:poly-gamma-glutamate synthesis protein (capsule biosynthesis protein)